MKIQNLTQNPTKLLKLRLIKTKVYKKKSKFKHLKIENVLYMLKKSLQIIYKYHINQKRILFINIYFINKIKTILKGTKHTFLTQSEWFNGKITNKKTEKEYNLIVILDSSIDKNITKEMYKTKVPIVVLQNKIVFSNLLDSYRVLGNFSFNKKKTRNHFFLNLLKVIFKKARQRSLRIKYTNFSMTHQFTRNKSLKKYNQ